jgi:hypothetical protein
VEGRLRTEAVLAAVFAALLSLAQRVLSTPVRERRRRVERVEGTVVFRDGSSEPLDEDRLSAASERALELLAGAVVLLAAALLARHLS